MSEIQFTPDQVRAIESEANMVITACPGSGKTSIVVEKIIREVEDLKPYQGVIGITFTVKASKELKKRCKKNGVETKASFFGTIDHFCLSEIIYPFISRIYGAAVIPLECKLFNDLDEELRAGLPDLGAVGNELKTEDYNLYEPIFRKLYTKGIIILETLGVLSVHVINNSSGCKKYIKSKYTSLYVDEYQDSSEPQHQLFISLLDLGLKAVAVGDIQQSIYAWRGSDPQYIQDLIAKPDVFEHHIVNINHRCHPSINNYANRLFNDNSVVQPTEETRVYQRVYTGNQLSAVQQINVPINKLVDDGLASSLSEIAILVRSNRSLEFVKNGLTVPFRVYSDDPLSSINTPTTKILNGLLFYYFDSTFLANDVLEATEQFRTLSTMERKKISRTIKALRDIPQDELKDNLIRICQALIEIDITKVEENALGRILDDQIVIKQYKPIDQNEVQVMTLHKSKGLEFDVVFHLDLYDWVFPRREFIQGCYDEIFSDWDQELNLHFVGITRAKEYCILVSSTRRLNSNDEEKSGNKSQFMTLPGLAGLYS
ncbi:MAG: ATP-dependent helicase [Desulfocapsa sp.]|uniref:DNA 3'-5' helicase n=1 Tax=Desulfotalea psychrophila TaxID=84980 RepID=A0ABS3AVW1_9BACT|nr:ATP-dependent helicase [Desulfocapsa sp.]MBN4068670.1 ATP-dependent helicase [Desulfotalea psychrophila]